MNVEDQNRDGFLSFEQVEERLVQAMLTAWRLPDREKGWMTVKAVWPDVWRHNHFGDYGEGSDAPIRPAALTRRDVGEMEEAFGWLLVVPAVDRKLIGLAISALARGEKQVPWLRLLRPMGVAHGAHGLRKRYGRAMNRVCRVINRRNASAAPDQSPLIANPKI